jgi:hypothetical protein
MKYATPEAFRAALDQRIRNEATAQTQGFRWASGAAPHP